MFYKCIFAILNVFRSINCYNNFEYELALWKDLRKNLIGFNSLFFYSLLFFSSPQLLFSQNEFFIQDGALVFINNQDGVIGQTNVSDMPTLYVNGEIVNLNNGLSGKGFFNNDGEIQVAGNWTNTAGGYSSTGDEVFVGDATQRLSGSFVGSGNRLNNMIVEKSANTVIELNDNIEVNNILRFGSGGRLRTDISGHGTDGSAYVNKVTLLSTIPGNLVGYNTTSADKYIEGKLERAISDASTYFFPIGVEPTSWDGIEPFQINFTSATPSFVSSYVFPKNINLIGKSVYNDLNGDGIYDKIEIDCELPLQWAVNTSGGTYNYSIEFYPGPTVETCNWDNTYGTPLSFTAKDALIGNVTETPSPYPFANQGTGFRTSPSGYSLAGLTSFSDFTLPGKSDLTPPILPVELILFKAYPVDNTFIELKWITVSEVNNDVFEVERSIDGVLFEKIGTVEGYGTTREISQYLYQDKEVQFNVLYYYRLKQIDFDGTTEYSNIVTARLSSNQIEIWSVSNFFPSPSTNNSYIQLITDKDVELNYIFYDMLGRIIEAKTQFFKQGVHLLNYQIEELPGGVYFLSISNHEANYTRKLTKIIDN